MIIYVIIGLLAVIAYLLVVISSKLSSLPTTSEVGRLFDARTEHQKSLLDEALSEVESLRLEIEQAHNTLKDIKYVTDIIEKYRLPSRSERAELDEISINEEAWDRVNKAKV